MTAFLLAVTRTMLTSRNEASWMVLSDVRPSGPVSQLSRRLWKPIENAARSPARISCTARALAAWDFDRAAASSSPSRTSSNFIVRSRVEA